MVERPAEAQPQGFTVGMLMLDAREPYVLGDPANALTFEFPVLYRVVSGATVEAVATGDRSVLDAIVDGARWLEGGGVRAIVSNCGFMLHYQEQVAAAVRVPVALSSLLQVPLALAAVGAGRRLGIVTASKRNLGRELLAKVGADDPDRLLIADMEDRPEFARILEERETIDVDALASETVAASEELSRADGELGGILLECALLTPYAPAVQRAIGLPVWDFNTLIEQLESSVNRRFRGSTRVP